MSSKKEGLMKLGIAIFAGIVSWGITHTEHAHVEWAVLMDPQHIFSLLGVVASVLGGWAGGVGTGRKREIRMTNSTFFGGVEKTSKK